MLLSIVVGSYILLLGTVENVKGVTPKMSKSEVHSITQQQTRGIVLEKTEANLKIDQDKNIVQVEEIDQNEKIVHNRKTELDVREVKKEENTKNTLKPHHLYVRNLEEVKIERETNLLKKLQQRDKEKRLKVYREKHSIQSEQ